MNFHLRPIHLVAFVLVATFILDLAMIVTHQMTPDIWSGEAILLTLAGFGFGMGYWVSRV